MRLETHKPILYHASKAQANWLFAFFLQAPGNWKLHKGLDTANVYRKAKQPGTGEVGKFHFLYMERLADGSWMLQVLDPLWIDTLFEFDIEHFRGEWCSRFDTPNIYEPKNPRP